MSISDINRTLALIDAWVQELEESRLSDECRKSGRSFFNFMQSRGVNAALMAKLIKEATDCNPAQLWRVEDAELLRYAIRQYESSIAVTDQDEKDGIQGTAERNVRHFWS